MHTLKEIEKKLERLLVSENYLEIIRTADNLEKQIQTLPKILFYKGLAFFKLNNFLEAHRLLEEALKADSTNEKILFNTALVNYFLKNYERSISLFEDTLKVKKNDLLSVIYLARCLFDSKKIKNSFKLLEYAIKIYPASANLYFELSSNFFKIKNYNLAIKFYSKVIELEPNFNEVYLNLAICFQSINDYVAALRNLEIQKKKTPNNHLVYYNLGNLYREMGDMSLAEKQYLQAIDINSFHTESYRMLTAIKKIKLDDIFVKNLNSAIEFHKKQNNTKPLLEGYYALSKIYEDNKDYENSYNCFVLANKLRRSEVVYSGSFVRDQFAMIKNLFNEDFIKKIRSYSKFLSEKPIFILGMPRSGTTLVEQIISAHKEVVSGGELTFMQMIIKKHFPKNDYNLFAKDVYEKLSSLVNTIGNEYCDELNKISKLKKVTDKLPFNFIFIGFIKCCLPNSKIIHCTRNSKDICISILKNYFPLDDVGFAHDEVEIVEYYKEYESLMSHWHSIFGEEIYNFSYEQNIANPTKAAKDLINYLELEWDDNCLNHHKTKNVIKTISTAQARLPIYSTSINSWKNYEKFLSSEFVTLK